MNGWEAWRESAHTCCFMGAYDTLGEAWCALRGTLEPWEHGMLTDGQRCIQLENMAIQQPPPYHADHAVC